MTRQNGTKTTFWKRTAKILKNPFAKKRNSHVESSESESEWEDYSEDESSLDSYSESDSNTSVEKNRVAALSSQAYLNKSDVNTRYARLRVTSPRRILAHANIGHIL